MHRNRYTYTCMYYVSLPACVCMYACIHACMYLRVYVVVCTQYAACPFILPPLFGSSMSRPSLELLLPFPKSSCYAMQNLPILHHVILYHTIQYHTMPGYFGPQAGGTSRDAPIAAKLPAKVRKRVRQLADRLDLYTAISPGARLKAGRFLV